MLGNLAAYGDYLQQALGKARGPVDLLVYSAGALSLMGLPKQYWDDIRSLTFVSPVVGREAISAGSDPLLRIAAVLLGSRLPSADQYLGCLDELLEHLLAAGVIVKVSLGREDAILDNLVIANRFSAYNRERTRIPIEMTNRPHGLTASQVDRLFEEASTAQSQSGMLR